VSIPDALIYQVRDNQMHLLEQGKLEIYQIGSVTDCFVLKIENFHYSLTKEMPILESSEEYSGLRSYVLSGVEGYYVVKITSVPDISMIHNLENFFAKTTKFAVSEPQKAESEPLVLENQKPQNTTNDIPTTINKGSELIKTGLITGAEYIAKGINIGGDYIQEKFLTKGPEVNVGTITMTTINVFSNVTEWVTKFKQSKVNSLTKFGKKILSSVGNQMGDNTISNDIKQFGSAAFYGLYNIYDGFMEAKDIIEEKGIHEVTTKIVTHKYGEKVGQATKKVLRSMSNVSQTTQIRINNNVKQE
jgi:hypothetical protein